MTARDRVIPHGGPSFPSLVEPRGPRRDALQRVAHLPQLHTAHCTTQMLPAKSVPPGALVFLQHSCHSFCNFCSSSCSPRKLASVASIAPLLTQFSYAYDDRGLGVSYLLDPHDRRHRYQDCPVTRVMMVQYRLDQTEESKRHYAKSFPTTSTNE